MVAGGNIEALFEFGFGFRLVERWGRVGCGLKKRIRRRVWSYSSEMLARAISRSQPNRQSFFKPGRDAGERRGNGNIHEGQLLRFQPTSYDVSC